MKSWISVLVAGVVIAATPAPAADAPNPEEFEKEHGSSFRITEEAAAGLTDPVEQSLHQVKLPEIIFNQSPMSAVMMRLQRATADSISTGTNKRGIDFIFNTKSLGKQKSPIITFAAKDVSILEVIRFVCAAGGLEYTISNGALVLQKAKSDGKKPEKVDSKPKNVKTTTTVPPKK